MSSNSAAAPVIRQIEVFYSYSHKDEALRKDLENHLSILRRQAVIHGWHDRQITAGVEWAGQIDEHINSADIILLLISASFLASDYCYDIELKRAMERHEAGEACVIPVILRPVDWKGAPFGKLQALPRDAKPIVKWPDRDEGFADVALGVRRAAEALQATTAVQAASGADYSIQTASLRIWNVPHRRNPNFTGREDLLRTLHDDFHSGRPAALRQLLYGPGGIGKTQVALEYAYRHRSEYSLVWWVRSDEPASFGSDYFALAEHLDSSRVGRFTQTTSAEAVSRALIDRDSWLLVFDNAESPARIEPFLPQGAAGHVLVTSRTSGLEGVARTIKVDRMQEDEAVTFLLTRTGQYDRETAVRLATDLEFVPLALEIASAYVDANRVTLSDYLRLLRKNSDGIAPIRSAFQQVRRSPVVSDASPFDVFLSHSHVDSQIVEILGAKLMYKGQFRVWLDKWTLIPGEKWQQNLAKGLDHAKTCAVCIGRNTPSGWFREEIERALNRQVADPTFRVIPVVLPDGNSTLVNDFLELRTWVEFKAGIDDPNAFHLLSSGIKGIAPGRYGVTAETDESPISLVKTHLMRIQGLRNEHLIDDEIAREYQRKLVDELISRSRT